MNCHAAPDGRARRAGRTQRRVPGYVMMCHDSRSRTAVPARLDRPVCLSKKHSILGFFTSSGRREPLRAGKYRCFSRRCLLRPARRSCRRRAPSRPELRSRFARKTEFYRINAGFGFSGPGSGSFRDSCPSRPFRFAQGRPFRLSANSRPSFRPERRQPRSGEIRPATEAGHRHGLAASAQRRSGFSTPPRPEPGLRSK